MDNACNIIVTFAVTPLALHALCQENATSLELRWENCNLQIRKRKRYNTNAKGTTGCPCVDLVSCPPRTEPDDYNAGGRAKLAEMPLGVSGASR